MMSTIGLGSDSMRCEIVPAMGGAIAGLWLGDIPVLRATPSTVWISARQAGCYPLLPFSNRMGHATMTWAGATHKLTSTAGDEPHAIHGVGWRRPWQVQESDSCFARLSLKHQADAAWPFAFEAQQSFRLSANELELTLSLRNLADVAAPVGLGWHPFFVKRDHSRISFDATARWEMNTAKLPTHRVAVSGLSTNCDSLDIDHCFGGWAGVVRLRDELLYIRISSPLNHLVLYTQPRLNFVAIEPVSHVNNALNLMKPTGTSADELGVRVLQQGESMSTEMCIHVERVS